MTFILLVANLLLFDLLISILLCLIAISLVRCAILEVVGAGLGLAAVFGVLMVIGLGVGVEVLRLIMGLSLSFLLKILWFYYIFIGSAKLKPYNL